jgi:hypothetical protein
MRPGLGPLRPRGNATPLEGWAGGAATRPDDPGVKVVKVVGKGNKYYRIEILPNLVLRIRESEIKAINGKVLLFKNPISRLSCIAHLE